MDVLRTVRTVARISGAMALCKATTRSTRQWRLTAGHTYDVSFWLGDNSGAVPSNPGIDMFVYATQGLPDGTQSPAPEPGTLALFGSSVLGLGGILRRRLLG